MGDFLNGDGIFSGGGGTISEKDYDLGERGSQPSGMQFDPSWGTGITPFWQRLYGIISPILISDKVAIGAHATIYDEHLYVEGKIYAANGYLLGNSVSVTRDGSDNLVFSDPVSGTKTLAQLIAAGSGNVISVGTPTNGQLAEWTDAIHIQGINKSSLTLTESQITNLISDLAGKASLIHNLIDTTNHPVSSLTPGHFLKALSSTTYGFVAHGLTKSDIGLSNVTNDAQVKKISSSTDNAIVRWDGMTGDLIQDSLMIVADDGTPNIPAGKTYNINGSPHNHAGIYQAYDATLDALAALDASAGFIYQTGADTFTKYVFAGTGSTNAIARSDHDHSGIYVPVSGSDTIIANNIIEYTPNHGVNIDTLLIKDGYIDFPNNSIDVRAQTARLFSYHIPTVGTLRLGATAGNDSMTGTDNILVGEDSGYYISSGIGNVFIGSSTGIGSSGQGAYDYNVAIGANALLSINSGANSNVAIGRQSLGNLTTGIANTAVGAYAANKCNSNFSIAVGAYAGRYASAGSNIFIGSYSGQGVDGSSTGYQNIFVGYAAGDSFTTATRCLLIGYNIDLTSATTNDQFRLGYSTTYLLEGSFATGTEWLGINYNFQMKEIGEPGTPPTGYGYLYVDNENSKIYFKNTTNTYDLTLGAANYSNGITYDSGNVKLGGDLNQATIITATPTFDLKLGIVDVSNTRSSHIMLGGDTDLELLTFTNVDYTGYASGIWITEGYVKITACTGIVAQSIVLNDTIMSIIDSKNLKGLEYYADYSSNWTDHSLVTKKWVTDNFGVIPIDDIFDWSTNKYTPYSSKSAGKFDSGSTDPTNVNRLNYDGYFYSTRLYSPSLIQSGTGTTNIALSQDNIAITVSSVARTNLTPNVADGSSAIAYIFDTVNLTTTGAKIISVRNQTAEKLYIDKDGIMASMNHYPLADDTYYLGKNSISSPLAWKALILKDTTNGNYYRITVVNGTITATQIT